MPAVQTVRCLLHHQKQQKRNEMATQDDETVRAATTLAELKNIVDVDNKKG